MNWLPIVLGFANAIDREENNPPEWNNPGSLTGADAGSFPTCGVGNDEGVLKFVNKADGWTALYIKLERMLTGHSHVYHLTMTLAQVGLLYSGENPNWGTNVASFLKVPVTTTLAQLAEMS